MVRSATYRQAALVAVAGTVVSGYLRTPALAQTPLAAAPVFQAADCRVEFPNFGTAATLLDATIRYLHAKSVSSEIIQNLESRKTELADQLRWVGGKNGLLIDIRIGEAKPPGVGSAFVGAAIIGPGTTPAAAYATNRTGWWVEASPPSGYQMSGDESFMVWIVPSGPRLSGTCIVGPARDQVVKEASVLTFSKESGDKLKAAEQSARYADLAQIAENRAASKDVRDRLRFAEEDRLKNTAALSYINQKLKDALDHERAAAAVVQTLGLLQGVLSVASMVSTAQSQLGTEAPPGLPNATNPGDVLKILDVYKTQTGNDVVTIRKELTVNVLKAQDSESKVRSGLTNVGVPAVVLP